MGNPLDTKEGLTLLDLNDLLAYWTGKLPPAPLGNNLVTKTSFSPLPIRLHPTVNNVFTGSHLLAQQSHREPFLQPQLHTTKLELKPIPLPKPTSFPLALLLNSTNLLHGYTPFSSQECHPFFSPSLLHDLVVNSTIRLIVQPLFHTRPFSRSMRIDRHVFLPTPSPLRGEESCIGVKRAVFFRRDPGELRPFGLGG